MLVRNSRPDTKEGGREEEKNRLGISTGRQAPGRPRNMKTCGPWPPTLKYERGAAARFPFEW